MRMTIIFMVVFTAWTVTNITIAESKNKKTIEKNNTYRKLASHKPGDITEAIEQIKKDRRPAGVRALTNRIRDGLPPQLLLLAVDALVVIKGNLAAKTLVELSSHRSQAVRKKVAMSLPALRSQRTTTVLVDMLDDQDAEVRSQAAVAIGKIKPQLAMNELITAAELGVLEASEIVGKQVRLRRVPKLIEMIDEKNIFALTPLFRELAARTDIPNNHKLAIVARLDEISTIGSRKLLSILAQSLPQWSVARQAAAKALNKEIEKKEKGKDKKLKGEDEKKKKEVTLKKTEEKEKR